MYIRNRREEKKNKKNTYSHFSYSLENKYHLFLFSQKNLHKHLHINIIYFILEILYNK